MRRIVVVAVVVAGVVLGALPVAGPAGAGAGTRADAAVSGWVVANQDPDGMFTTDEGSITIAGVGGGEVSCPLASGFGWADSGTLRPQDFFGEVGTTTYDAGCTGPGSAGLAVYSSPGTVLVAETYDAATDEIEGSAYPWLWGLFMETPGCQIDLYPVDSNAGAPLTFANATATLELGPVEVAVTRAEGAGCAGLPAVGDELTAELTLVATPGFTVHPLPD